VSTWIGFAGIALLAALEVSAALYISHRRYRAEEINVSVKRHPAGKDRNNGS
jgi:hypothetical protein